MGENMIRDSDLMKSRLIIEINFNGKEELIFKLNKICNELNVEVYGNKKGNY